MQRADRAPANDVHFRRAVLVISPSFPRLRPRTFAHGSRHADASWIRKPFQARGNIHSIAEDVATVGHDIPEFDADAELHRPFLWHVGIALAHALLRINSTGHRIHYTAELGQWSRYSW
jgi:hypothetical protein